MHGPVIGGARGLVHPNACKSALLKPMDQSSSFERQSVGNFSRGDTEKVGVGKRDWQKPSAVPFEKACIGLSPDADATFASISKRRSLGWHGYIDESGRHSRGYTQLPQPTPLFGLPSSAGRGVLGNNYERDLFGKSLAENSSSKRLVSGNRSNEKEERSIPPTRLSPRDAKDAGAVAMDIEYLSHPPLAVALPDCNSFWDVDNKVSASCSQDLSQAFDRKYKSRLPVDTDISSGRAGFIQPNSKGEWSPCDTDLEARLDRYRRNNQDTVAADLFASKDSPSDWKSQERKSLGSISPFSSISTKQSAAEGGMRLPGFLDAPLLSPSVISPRFLRQDTNCDEINHPSPRKRPRLGWGQGLAKYEKKKVVEHEKVAGPASLQEKSEADLEISAVPSIRSSGLAISMVHDEDAENCLSSDIRIKGNFMEDESRKEVIRLEIAPVMHKQGSIFGGNKSLEDEQSGHKLDSFPQVSYVRENDPCLQSTHAPEQSSEHKLIESYAYPFEYNACLSKELILLNIEKVELEIDLVEKEVANLNSEIQSQDITDLNPTDNGNREQGAVDSGSLVSSDPQSNTICNDKVTLACLSSLEEKCTVNTVQTSGGIDAHNLDASAIVAERDRDEFQQNVTFDNSESQSLMYEGTNEINLSMKSTEPLLEEQTLLISNICSQENVDLSNEEASFLNSNSHGALSSFYQAIMNENQEQANDAGNAFSHLLPSNLSMMGGKLYSSPEGAPKWIQNEEFHQRTKEELKERLARRKKVFRFKEQVLALRYQALSKIWKQEQLGLLQRKDRSKVIRKYDGDRRNAFLNNQRSSSRLRLLSFGIAKHDALSEELPVVKKLLLQSPSEKGYLKMPAMIIDEKERSSRRFVTMNALVEDPVAVEQERRTINPWTLEEKQGFLEKFAMFHKNFAKIASYIPQKTVADCIEFYYRNQNSEEFEKVHRRQQQLKKRKDLTRCSPYLATTLRANRFSESNAARVDALSMVAALASSDSFAMDCPRSTRHGSGKLTVRSCVGSAAEPGILDGFGARKSPGFSEMKFGGDLLSLEGIDSGCALALCSLSSAALLPLEKGNVDRIGGNGCLNSPSYTKRTNTRHLARPRGARNAPIQNDIAKASRKQVDSHWSDLEREFFLDALKLYGKNFSSIALHVGTKTVEQCKGFFSKTRKCLGLDELLQMYPPKELTDRDEEMGHPEPTLEVGNINPNPIGAVIMADSTRFLKDETQHSKAEAKTVEFLETHSNVGNEPEVEEKVSSDTFSHVGIDQDYFVAGGGEKRLEQGAYANSDAAVKDVQLREFNVDTQLKSTISIENQVKTNPFNSLILSCKSDPNHSDVRSILSATKGDLDAERSDSLGFEVKMAKEDAPAVIETIRTDGTFELKEAFVSEASLQADICGSCIDEDSKVKDKEETLEPKHDINEVVGTISLANVGGKGSLPLVVLQPQLDPINSSSDSPDVLQKEKYSKVLVGGETKLRREPTCWTPEEKEKFVAIIRKHGKSWSILQENLPAKSLTQIKTYFQNSKAKLGYQLTELLGNKADKVSSRKRKAEDSDTSSNAGSVGQVSQQSNAYFLEDGLLKSSVVGMNALGAAMPSVGQTDRDLTSIKGIQVTQQVSSGGFASKSSTTLTDQDPASAGGTQINRHMFSASQGFIPTSYPRFDSASSDLPTRSYDFRPPMYMLSQVFGSNLQNPEEVVHDQEQSKTFQQDPINQQQKQQELLAMLQQQQHIMHQIQQHQRMESMSKSPLLHSQSTYPEQIQTTQIKQLQQGSLMSGIQHMQVLQSQKQNKGTLSKQQQQPSLQADSKHPQVYDVGRIIAPYHTVIQNQSFTQKENDWEQLTHNKQKAINQQVANHVLQQPSQQCEVQLWQRHQQQLIRQKQQELLQLHLQQAQQRLQLQQQHLLKPFDKQLAQDHQQVMPQQHHHQIPSNFQSNQPHSVPQIRKNQQHLRQQMLLQHKQVIPVQQPGIIHQGAKLQEHVQPHRNDHFTDQEQREPSQLVVSTPLSQCALQSVTTTIGVPCQAGHVDSQTLCEITSESRNEKSLSQSRRMSCETQMAQTARGGDIKLFGQSLLSQPLSAACQTGTISTGNQEQPFENLWLPLNPAPDSTARKLSKSYEKHSVKVVPPSPLPTWSNAATSGNIDMCIGAWSGFQTNISTAVVRDAESRDGQDALSHSEICHLSQSKDSRIPNPEGPFSPSRAQQIEKPDGIETDKEHERRGTSRNDDLCIGNRQTRLMPVAGGFCRVDSRPTNPSSRASGTDHCLRQSEGLDSTMAATCDDSTLRSMGFLSKSINTFPSLSNNASNPQSNEDDRQFTQLSRASGNAVEATRLSGPYALSTSTSQSRTVASELFQTLKDNLFLAPHTKSEW